CTNGPRNDTYCSERIERTPFEILAGNVFQCLPASPEVHPVPYFGVARNRSDFGIHEMWDQPGNSVGRYYCVSINSHKNFFIAQVFQTIVQSLSFASIRLREN